MIPTKASLRVLVTPTKAVLETLTKALLKILVIQTKAVITSATLALKKKQVEMRALYCGHLYSLFLRKWTHWHQRGQVFTVWREG
jgi:hypothetical protein